LRRASRIANRLEVFKSIKPGAGIAVVAPAGPAPQTTYQQGLDILAQRYRLVRTYSPQKAGAAPWAYLAASDEDRAKAFNDAVNDRAVEAVFCARGGYGTTRILDTFDLAALARRGLPLVGFSDITAMHLSAARHGLTTIHGPVVNQLAVLPGEDIGALFSLLEGTPTTLYNLSGWKSGRARGRLIGGNLALIASLVGTTHMPRLEGAILLIEEVGEAPYRIDRMVTQLLMSHTLDGISGIVIGDLVSCEGPQGIPPRPTKGADVLRERLSVLDIPIAADAPIGHARRNVAVPMGQQAELDADKGTLKFLD
jgi:muramoyltetrapeptide carboxypeptidase